MIPDPDTLKRIRAQAKAHADGVDGDSVIHFTTLTAWAREMIRRAYLAGADAGYAAAKAEERKP